MANSFFDRIVDVTQPSASGLASAAIVPGAGNGANNSTRLAALLTEALTNSPNTAFGFYWPINLYEFPTTVTFPNSLSFRMFGGGGTVKGYSAMASTLGACTILRWTGNATGPMFRIRDTDGDVWEYMNFDGAIGPDTNASGPGDGLAALIKYERDTGNVGCLYHHFKNCSFHRAQRLFYAAGGALGGGTAEFTFSKCMFNCGDQPEHAWTSQAFYSDNPQCVNTLFDSNCEFNFCAYCAYTNLAGRVRFESPTIAFVGTILARQGGGANTSGDAIINPHLDGGSGTEGRKALYKSIEPDATYGPVILETPKYGSVSPSTNEFAEIDDFVANALTLTHPIRMRSGDHVMFLEKAAIDAGDYTGMNKATTTINTRTDDNTYTTTDSATTLGITDPGDWYCVNGEALVTCVSSDFVELRNAFLPTELIAGGRLARLSSSPNGGRPKFVVANSMGNIGTTFDGDVMDSFLTRSGTTYWRFENFAPYLNNHTPATFGNFGGSETIIIEPGGGSGGGGGVTNIDFERVPSERTFVLLPTPDEGLIAETVKSFAIGSDPLIAIEFVHDMPLGGYITSVLDPVIEAGPTIGLTFVVGHDRSQVKLYVSTLNTGLYVLLISVTYNDGSTAAGRITFEVVD
jgi:hypothetical protein